MTNKLRFLFGIHIHQPLGNFLYVFEKLHQTCYGPFLKIMSEHPALKFNFHASGHLLQWLEENHPESTELLGHMVNKGQAELLTGGFYEPILAAIPRRDRQGQIRMHKRYLKRRFGVDALGIWLTERVWEPNIVEDLIASGLRYVLVDDRHFRVSGFGPDQLHSYYITEAEGKTIAVFPIDERLRYSIPFRLVEVLSRYLQSLSAGNHDAAIYMDDGEKFGGWPGTQEWVYEKKWLHKFLQSLELLQESFLETCTFTEFMQKVPPRGICYLPNASYTEMEEWALPAAKGLELEELRKSFAEDAAAKVYLRGGHWKNFLVKYPEANRMHKKMLILSEMVRHKRKKQGDLLNILYKTQCNDAYWHGVFGGLYLPPLRHEVWGHLAELEKKLRVGEAMEIETRDVDCDGQEEAWAHSRHFSAVFKPSYGGHLKEYIPFTSGVNYLNTLTRRFETYHRPQAEKKEDQEKGQTPVASIHHLARASQDENPIDYDPFERGSFADRFFALPLSLQEFKTSSFAELGDFACQPFAFKVKGTKITMTREGRILDPDKSARPLKVIKEFRLSPRGSIEAGYTLYNPGPEELKVGFGVEFNISLPVMNPDGGQVRTEGKEVPLGNEGGGKLVDKVDLADWFTHSLIRLRWSLPADLLFFPVGTVSQSEKDFDYIPQQLCLIPHWPIALKSRGSWCVKIHWETTQTKPQSERS